jgi:hypothetical protein
VFPAPPSPNISAIKPSIESSAKAVIGFTTKSITAKSTAIIRLKNFILILSVYYTSIINAKKKKA